MPRKTGISADTSKKTLLGYGAFYVNYGEDDEFPLGAVKGTGSKFVREIELTDILPEDADGPIMGMKFKSNSNCSITVNTLEIVDGARMTELYPALDLDTTGAEYDLITGSNDFVIPDEAYLKNVTFVGYTLKGQEVIIVVKNALPTSNIDWPLLQKSDVVPEITFVGHRDPAAPTEEPWEMRYPKAV